MSGRVLYINGDEAVAEGVRLARPHVISAYPITPQTITVERLAEFVEEGTLNSQYIHVESEHSAISAAIGASSVGARTFTATSSQGLLYMSEGLYYASGARYPIVMMNANRALAAPWNIYGDQSDSLSQLNSGWIQVYVEDAQEALDMIIQAYKIAENKDVLTPVMVNLDGFVLTHTYEPVEIQEQERVDQFLPEFNLDYRMDMDNPVNACMSAGDQWHMELRMKQELGMKKAENVIMDTDREYGDIFGRYYGGMVEGYNTDDADVILITAGSVSGTVRTVVDKMRGEGKRVGLLKLRYLRPFPRLEIQNVLDKVKAAGVIDKDISYGYEGTIFTNVNSSIAQLKDTPRMINFIGGLGGRDISRRHIEEMFNMLYEAAEGKKYNLIQYVNARCK